MTTTIRIWPETPSRRQARAVLVHLAVTLPNDTFEDLDRKLPVHDALCALDGTLPAGWMLAPIDPQPGDVADAYRLLAAAVHEHYADDTTAGPDDGPDGGLGQEPGEQHGERPGGETPAGAGPGAPISVRDVIATGIAASHLRALLDPSSLTHDPAPATGPAVYPSAGPVARPVADAATSPGVGEG